MEAMTIHVQSVTEEDGQIRAQARAEASQAIITVECWFAADPGLSRRELWLRARDQVLRYLDPA